MFQQYTSIYSYDAHTLDVVASRRFINASSCIQVITFYVGFLFQNPYNLTKQERGNTRGIFSIFMNGELRYIQEVCRYLNVTAGVRGSKKATEKLVNKSYF